MLVFPPVFSLNGNLKTFALVAGQSRELSITTVPFIIEPILFLQYFKPSSEVTITTSGIAVPVKLIGSEDKIISALENPTPTVTG